MAEGNPGRLRRLAARVRSWVGRLSRPALIALAALALAAVAVAGALLYRTYSYVQHDNDFCLQCHLMQAPYEQFARSAHRGLGCKACHRPTLVERSRMGLTQVLFDPDSISVHAEVPNETCAECHIEGNPEEWRIIAASAGHRVHLESDDPSLRELECVQCHSSGVHEFTATDKTCGQAGCHENTEVQLGRMGQLTIHCGSCHEFSRPIAAANDSLDSALRPQREECLSCHAMQLLVQDFPEHDPHDAACGACHQPHEQRTPAEAVQSCATGGCHAAADTLTPFHRGLDPGVLDRCLLCHEAHDFRVDGENCTACHQDIGGAGMLPSLLRHAAPVQRQDTMEFSHARHATVTCTACHETERTHGGVTITSVRDCQECHHTGSQSARCESCHAPADYSARETVNRTLTMSVGAPKARRLPFDHDDHASESCATCHVSSLTRTAAQVSCESCHDEHHETDANCMACHARPPARAHSAEAHVTCTGAGCHAAAEMPFDGVPRTRTVCLACHQDLTDHRPGRNCEDCHALPAPRSGRGAAP